MIYAPNFIIQEFVPKSIYEALGEGSTKLMDERIIILSQLFRTRYGKITINSWHNGGQYKESGLRLPETTTGAKYSQHKYGRAVDLKFEDHTIQEIYSDVIKNTKLFHEKGLRVIEDIAFTKTWLHIDCRFTGRDNEIIIVQP